MIGYYWTRHFIVDVKPTSPWFSLNIFINTFLTRKMNIFFINNLKNINIVIFYCLMIWNRRVRVSDGSIFSRHWYTTDTCEWYSKRNKQFKNHWSRRVSTCAFVGIHRREMAPRIRTLAGQKLSPEILRY